MSGNPPIVSNQDSDDQEWAPGDFGAQLVNNELVLPFRVKEALSRHSIDSALKLLDYVHNFPTAIREIFGWTYDEVEQAQVKLCALLDSHVSRDFINPTSSRQVGHGVPFPSGWKPPDENGPAS